MSEAGGAANPRGRGDEAEEVLRGKYLDYCSAQVADFLLLLSPDQMYLLAEDAAEEVGREVDLAYTDIVRLASDRISSSLVLPPFERWVEDYRERPEFYDAYLLGFWEGGGP